MNKDTWAQSTVYSNVDEASKIKMNMAKEILCTSIASYNGIRLEINNELVDGCCESAERIFNRFNK